MEKYLDITQIVVAGLLVGLILLQQRGAGLGGAFGGLGEFYSTRRGIEKAIFIMTIVAASLFVLLSLLTFVI